ncbi:Mitochondrial import receptor subunit TOM20 -like protein B [Trichinella pseudospiralis]|uniref:Mitochondrial import receptor subunit TOM20-like protein B n=1 Tax=Trichinella pseudospiralis TaxID=6337 RepID=A0A0V1INU5_TRIPS|nr:Mitochondrial import receptor subunit TOM20 -like protein B [Trichinella pseudospiralis]
MFKNTEFLYAYALCYDDVHDNGQRSCNMLAGKIILWGFSGLAGALFVAYCIYFDRKRRQDPQYKKKIAEKRKKQTEMTKKKNKIKLPTNPLEMQAFVSYHAQMLEECTSRNKYEEAAEHLAYIFACSGESGQMQDMVRYMFPPIVMQQMESKLPSVREELYSAIGSNTFAAANAFDDLE